MKYYKIPYRTYVATAKDKARIIYGGPDPGALTLCFWAESHAAAERVAQALIFPGDPRPIRGRSNVSIFARETDDAGRAFPFPTATKGL